MWKAIFGFTVEGFKGMWCRTLLHYADWASNIPEISSFNCEDQFNLIFGRCVPAKWLIIAHRSLRNSKGRKVLLSGGSYIELDNSEENEHFEAHP
jgi:hypothetical protein